MLQWEIGVYCEPRSCRYAADLDLPPGQVAEKITVAVIL